MVRGMFYGLLIFSIALLAGCRLNDPETWKNCTWHRAGEGLAEGDSQNYNK